MNFWKHYLECFLFEEFFLNIIFIENYCIEVTVLGKIADFIAPID